MAHTFGGDQPLKELDSRGRKTRNVHRDLLQRQDGALSPPVANGVGHFGAAVARRRGDFVNGVVANQLPDIGDHPGSAGFNKLVVVKLPNVFFENRGLDSGDGQQGLQRLAVFYVVGAIDGRQKSVELRGVQAHDSPPFRERVKSASASPADFNLSRSWDISTRRGS